MRWKLQDPSKSRIEYWFAWFPVRLRDTRTYVWLERVIRTRVAIPLRYGKWFTYWEYSA